jgi:MFS family permease
MALPELADDRKTAERGWRATITRALIDVAPLRSSPAFRRLWIGRLASWLGGEIAAIAVLFQVWQSTRSTVWTGAVGLTQAIPVLVFGLFAGSIVDRGDRRRVYLIAISGQVLCAVFLAVQGSFRHPSVLGVLLLVALLAGLGTVAGPASRTFIPELLPRGQVAAGLALSRIASQATGLLGPALGGLVLARWGVSGCYLLDALCFIVAFAGAFGLPSLRVKGDLSRPGLGGVVDGFRFLGRQPLVRGALITELAAMLLAMPMSLFPLINQERFGNDPRTLGLFFSAIAVGGVLASVLSGVYLRMARPGLVMLTATASWGAALALFGVSSNPWVGLAFLVLAGVADTVSVVSRGTIVQQATPGELLGRMSAVEQMVGQAGADVGNMGAGLVAAATSGLAALLAGGLLCVAATALVAVTTPALRRSRIP